MSGASVGKHGCVKGVCQHSVVSCRVRRVARHVGARMRDGGGIRRWICRRGCGSEDSLTDGGDYVAYVIVCDVWTCGETDAHLEEFLAHAVDVGGGVAVDGLSVHRFPERTRLYVRLVKPYTQSLHVVVRLAVGRGCGCRVDDACRPTDRSGDDGFVCVFLTLDPEIRIEGGGAEPEVGVKFRGGIGVHGDTLDIGEQVAIEFLHMAVVGDVVVDYGHLTASDPRADIAHAVVVADLLVLIVGVGLACLGGVPHDTVPVILIAADECAASGCGYHLVAVEGEDSVSAECAQHPTVVAGAETFGGILDHGDPVTVCDLHDAVNPVGHAVESHGDDRLGFPACLCNAVFYSLLKEVGIHVPCILFGINEDRSRPEVGYRMGGCTERE